MSSTKRQKMAISRSIVEAIRALEPPGRFLEKDLVTVLWTEIGYKKAIEKTSQALRDGAANLRKQLSADFGDPNFLNAVFDEKGNGDKCDGVSSCCDSVNFVGDTGVEAEIDSPLQTTIQDTFQVREEVESSAPTEKSGDGTKLDAVVSEKKIAVDKRVSPKVRIMLPFIFVESPSLEVSHRPFNLFRILRIRRCLSKEDSDEQDPILVLLLLRSNPTESRSIYTVKSTRLSPVHQERQNPNNQNRSLALR